MVLLSDIGPKALHYEHTADRRAEVFKAVVVRSKGSAFYKNFVQPHKKQVR